MNIEFLLSFKDCPEVSKLDDIFIKSLPDNFVKMYSKKVKKKIIKPISKSNILKNSKLQLAKNKDENKVNLILNKLSEDNIDNIIIEFLGTFSEIDQEKYNVMLKTIYLKLIKDEKFIYIYYKFYNIINSIYTSLFDLDNKYFIDIIQHKILYDYENNKLNDDYKFLSKLKTEEHRINNLKLIILLVESKNFKLDIIKNVSDIIVKDNKVPDFVFWFNDKIVLRKIKLEKYYDILASKLDDKISNRFKVLLKNLLKIEDIDIEEEDSEEQSEDSCDISIKEEKLKSDFEIEIDNIIDEFLLLEDSEEIISFIKENIDNIDDTKIFVNSVLNFYFNSTLSNFSKFKKLFISLKKAKIIDNSIYKSSLSELVNDENKLDYNNFDKKLKKIQDIYKIVKINLNNDLFK